MNVQDKVDGITDLSSDTAGREGKSSVVSNDNLDVGGKSGAGGEEGGSECQELHVVDLEEVGEVM